MINRPRLDHVVPPPAPGKHSTFPNILYALDLSPGKEGTAKWKYEPDPVAAAQGVACCNLVNRGAAFADGRIFYNTLDDNTVAVDAATGKEDRVVATVKAGEGPWGVAVSR